MKKRTRRIMIASPIVTTTVLIWAACLLWSSGCVEDIDPGSLAKVTFADGRACSGFFVETNKVITSSHCYRENMEMTVTYLNSYEEVIEVLATMSHVDDGREGVLLLEGPMEGVPVEWQEAHIGYSVEIHGWLFDDPHPKVSRGRVLSHWSNKYTTTADSSSGWSGGPVTHNGCVIGMNHGRTSIGTSYVVNPGWY